MSGDIDIETLDSSIHFNQVCWCLLKYFVLFSINYPAVHGKLHQWESESYQLNISQRRRQVIVVKVQVETEKYF